MQDNKPRWGCTLTDDLYRLCYLLNLMGLGGVYLTSELPAYQINKNMYTKPKGIITCTRCYQVVEQRAYNQKFCSRDCKLQTQAENRRPVKYCHHCNKAVPALKIKYCSAACVHKAKYQRNKDKLRARADEWIKEHPEKKKQYARTWRERTGKTTTYYRRRRNSLKIAHLFKVNEGYS